MDWLGVIVNLTGFYIMANNRVIAAYIFLVGNALWITWGLSNRVWSVVFIQVCFIFLNVRMIRKGG